MYIGNTFQVRDLQKKMQQVENELDNTLEKLGGTNVKLDEKDKAYQLAEGEAAALQRKYVLIKCFHESWIFFLYFETKLSFWWK